MESEGLNKVILDKIRIVYDIDNRKKIRYVYEDNIGTYISHAILIDDLREEYLKLFIQSILKKNKTLVE